MSVGPDTVWVMDGLSVAANTGLFFLWPLIGLFGRAGALCENEGRRIEGL